MYSDPELEEPCRPPSGIDVQQKSSSPSKRTQDKSPKAPEKATTQRDTSIPTKNLPNTSKSGHLDKSLANGTQTAKHDLGSEVPQDQTEGQSTPLEPSRHPATLEMVPPSADNSSQVRTLA